MLYSALIDPPFNVTNGWNIENDEYNNSYIIHDSTHQKIRMGKTVKKKLEAGIDFEDGDVNITTFEIPDNIFVSNNNKNMNVSIMNYWTGDIKEREAYIAPNILYITLYNLNYKLISYDAHNHDVIKTYRKGGYNQGCAIVFNNSNEKEVLFTIYAKKKEDFIKIEIIKDADNIVSSNEIYLSGEQKKRINDEYRKVTRKYVHFRMEFPEGKLVTSTYFVDPEYTEMAKELIKDISNSCMIITSSDSFFVEGKDKKTFDQVMTEQLKNARVKAITSIGVDVPYEFCKEYGILYLFKYDLETKKLVCLKSN